MIVQLIDDDAFYGELLKRIFKKAINVSVHTSLSVEQLKSSIDDSNIDLVLVDVRRPDSVSIHNDVQTLQSITSAPIVFISGGDTENIRDVALASGAEAVVDKDDLSEGLIRQLVLNAKARGKSGGKGHTGEERRKGGRRSTDRRRTDKNEQAIGAVSLERNFAALRAPLAYLESGLSTLGDVMRETGKAGSSQFVDHMRETIQAISQYTQDDLSVQSGGSLNALIQQSLLRIQKLAHTRNINLRVDWEDAGFRHIGSDALVQLGVQHLLEGVLRCCSAKDGVWMQGEKADETGASVIRVHMSRRVLPSSDILFPEAKPSVNVGLDALSSMQLGGLLLMLSPKQVQLSSEERQQLLSVYL